MRRAVSNVFGFVFATVSLFAAGTLVPARAADIPIDSRFAEVNGVKLHYLVAGEGPPVILLHGYAQTSHMWLPLIPELAKTHLVIAPDLRGFGESDKPDCCYDKKAMAEDIHALAEALGLKHVGVAGHDIGLMVAYAYAAQHPDEVDRIALMDAFLPGIGDWNSVFLLRDLWHFHFFGPTPLALVTGRERIYLDHFWNDFAADPAHSVSEADRDFYVKAYAAAGRHEGGHGGVPQLPAGRGRLRGVRQDDAHHADAGALRREGGRPVPHRAGQDGRRQCRGRHHQGLRPLADGRGA